MLVRPQAMPPEPWASRIKMNLRMPRTRACTVDLVANDIFRSWSELVEL